MDPLQTGLLAVGGAIVLAVMLYNGWVSWRSAPRQARTPPASAATASAPAPDQTDPQAQHNDPQADDDFQGLPQPERAPMLDAAIDVIATIELDQEVSGDAALAALPGSRRVGTKAFHIEGRTDDRGSWEPVTAGRRYQAFKAGVQLANRMGPLNEIEFSEFVVKTQAFADAIGGMALFSDMLAEVARARELDQFASAHDAQLGFTLVARATAWSPGYIQQHASRLGFVAGAIPGRMVLPAQSTGLPPVLSLTFDAQAAMADDPALSAIRECVLTLDVPQVSRSEAPYARMQQAAVELARQMDGVITDGSGQVLGADVMQRIGVDLERLCDSLDQRGLSAGTVQARRLFS